MILLAMNGKGAVNQFHYYWYFSVVPCTANLMKT